MAYTYKYLQTNFKDDIINEDANNQRKYRMIQNEDGTVSFEDVTNYLQKGSLFGGNNINDTNGEINRVNLELRGNIYGKYIGTIFVSSVLSGIIRYILITKVVYREGSDSITEEYVDGLTVEESTAGFEIDLQPKHIYTFSIDISPILDKYKKLAMIKRFLLICY